MSQNDSRSVPSTTQLIAIPALITLAITIIRLMGELRGWSKVWFNPEPGGPLGVIGIVWLVPIFGVYFATKLANTGDRPSGGGRVALFALIGIAVMAVGFVLAFRISQPGMPLSQTCVAVAAIIAVYIQLRGWPSLAKALLWYGLAARIPVLVIMFLSIKGNWGTHYDGPPPNFPTDITWFPKFILIGVLPQLFFWVPFTIIVGALFGAIAIAVSRSKQASAEAGA